MVDTNVPVWGIHAGRPRGQSKQAHKHWEEQTDLLFKSGYVAIGWPELGNLSKLPPDRTAFRLYVADQYGQTANAGTIAADAGTLFRFVHKMNVGDVVAFRSRIDGLVHVGTIAGPYTYDPSLISAYPNRRRVEWFGAYEPDELDPEALRSIKAQSSLFQARAGAEAFRALLRGKAQS